MNEIWKEVIGYENKYWVSNLGRVKSNYLGETIFHPVKDKSGYLRVSLSKNNLSKTFLVHRLVAIHFIPNPLCLREINHKDGNKENNYVDNLEWCTRKENIQHAEKMGLMYHPTSVNNWHAKSFFQFDLQGNLLKFWECLADCARYLYEHDEKVKSEFSNVRSFAANLSHTLTGKHKSCCDYIFSYSPKVDPKEHEKNWGANSINIEATDKKTGEKFTFKSIKSMDGYVMPNGQKVQATMICKTCKGKRKSHGGYYWRYLRETN